VTAAEAGRGQKKLCPVEYNAGQPRALDLSRQLLTRVGKGYSARNLWYFRDFYVTYRDRAPSIRTEGFRTSLVQNSKPVDAAKMLHEADAEFAEGFSGRLSWTHYRALLGVRDPAARAFYEIEAERENWSTPTSSARSRCRLSGSARSTTGTPLPFGSILRP
jgi:hypothetical protein